MLERKIIDISTLGLCPYISFTPPYNTVNQLFTII